MLYKAMYGTLIRSASQWNPA